MKDSVKSSVIIYIILALSNLTFAQRPHVTAIEAESGWSNDRLRNSTYSSTLETDCFRYYVEGNDLKRIRKDVSGARGEIVDYGGSGGWSTKTLRMQDSYIYWVTEGVLYKANLTDGVTMDVDYIKSSGAGNYIHKCTRSSCAYFTQQVSKCHAHINK